MFYPQLYFTSYFLLLPAIYGRMHWIGPVYTVMLGLSVLHHAKYYDKYTGQGIIKALDKFIAHGLAIGLASQAITIHAQLRHNPEINKSLYLFWACFMYSFVYYYLLRVKHLDNPVLVQWLHASFHAIASYGGCCVAYSMNIYKSPL